MVWVVTRVLECRGAERTGAAAGAVRDVGRSSVGDAVREAARTGAEARTSGGGTKPVAARTGAAAGSARDAARSSGGSTAEPVAARTGSEAGAARDTTRNWTCERHQPA